MASGCHSSRGGINITRTHHCVALYVHCLSCLFCQELPLCRGTRRFVTVLKRVCDWSLSWISYHSVHSLPCSFCKCNFNIVLPSTPRFSMRFFPSGFRNKTRYAWLSRVWGTEWDTKQNIWHAGMGARRLWISRHRWREGLDDLGFECRQGQEISSPKRSDRHRGRLAAYSMSNGGSFPGAKVQRLIMSGTILPIPVNAFMPCIGVTLFV
jgi:hypothetical protein